MRLRPFLGVTWLSPLLLLAHSRDAGACGGCFHQASSMSTVVTAHRMAFATSKVRTVLWDQIQYSGNPNEFSWVLPIKGDVKLEAADDAWFEALEAVTNTNVTAPQLNCFYRQSGGGCSCGGTDSATSASGGFAPRGPNGGGGVAINHEGTVGPYQFVEITGSSMSLLDWLPQNGYAIPPDIAPVIDAYVNEGFGFLALKLRPAVLAGQNPIQQMTPVRVITEGAGMTLPLRMVAAGTGPFVGITLYVIAEGRYEPRGFGQAKIDTSKLTFDWSKGQSNYSDLRAAALAAQSGNVWLTSFSSQNAFTRTYNDPLGQSISFSVNRNNTQFLSFVDLTNLYFGQAAADANFGACPQAGGIHDRLLSSALVVDNCPSAAPDAGVVTYDAGIPPPSSNCDVAPAGTLGASTLICDGHSDIAAAMIGMHPGDVWLSRLEANLPRGALAGDLVMQPADEQVEVSNQLRAVTHINPPCDLLENHPEVTSGLEARGDVRRAGFGALSMLGFFFARRWGRKRSAR